MNGLLIAIVVILGVLALARLAKVFELAASLKGETDPGEVPEREIKTNAALMLAFCVAFFAFFIWLTVEYAPYLLPESASEHGVELDWLMDFNMLIITIVFFITHVLLFYFTWKYQYRKDRVATYFAHSNKLEMIWTIVPAIFLAVIIVYGLAAWNDITDEAEEGAEKIELYSKQFQWLARYPGADGEFGDTYFKYVVDNVAEYEVDGSMVKDTAWVGNELALHCGDPRTADDIVVDGEFYLPLGKEVDFQFRSQDVIHSAYMPHFRAQMNTVPGMVTKFKFKPTITTAEMREKVGDPEFDYILICNKICGASHFNMKMIIKVVPQDEYDAWLADQTPANEKYTAAFAHAPAWVDNRKAEAEAADTEGQTAQKIDN